MSLFNTLKFIVTHPLNHRDPVAALFRFFKWQIGSRLVGGGVVRDWIGGSRFLVRRGDTALTGNIYTGLFEFPEMAFLLHFLREGDLYVDVGANVGSYVILATAVAGAKGVAFEPVPVTFKHLQANIALNNLQQSVRCLNKGVGARRGEVRFTATEGATNHVLAPDEECKEYVNVEVTTLDDELADERPIFLKVDVEGFESNVIGGALALLKHETLKAALIELNGSGTRYGFDESRIVEWLRDYGFRPYAYRPRNRELVELPGINSEDGNTLFLRDRLFVEQRLKIAPRFEVHGQSV